MHELLWFDDVDSIACGGNEMNGILSDKCACWVVPGLSEGFWVWIWIGFGSDRIGKKVATEWSVRVGLR